MLFIGNSYTHVNDLPGMVAALARAGGHKIATSMVAPGGWTLAQHADSEATLAQLRASEWDYVVLQEQSVRPTQARDRAELMYPAARNLAAEVDKAGASLLLYMTWGRRDGLPEKGFPDFDAMQAELRAGYTAIGDELGAIVVPVGLAWRAALTRDSAVDLWQEDGSHPSPIGTYLAACTFYAAVFRESPEGLPFTVGLAADLARLMQGIAAETVLGERA
jgi:hypothetical protein